MNVKSEMIRRVYETQKAAYNTGDWYGLVENDRQQLGIQMSDSEIQGVSKEWSRTLDVKEYFKHQHRDTWCISCGLFPETQSHLLQCPVISRKLNYVAVNLEKYDENYIYGSLHQQKIITKIYSQIVQIREELRNQNLECNHPSIEGPFAHVFRHWCSIIVLCIITIIVMD